MARRAQSPTARGAPRPTRSCARRSRWAVQVSSPSCHRADAQAQVSYPACATPPGPSRHLARASAAEHRFGASRYRLRRPGGIGRGSLASDSPRRRHRLRLAGLGRLRALAGATLVAICDRHGLDRRRAGLAGLEHRHGGTASCRQLKAAPNPIDRSNALTIRRLARSPG